MQISQRIARSPSYEFGRPWVPRSQKKLKSRYNCVLRCHSYNDINCATRNARFFYKWLVYHFQTKSYVKCPKNMTSYRHVCFSNIKATTPGHLPFSLPSNVREETSSTTTALGTRNKTQGSRDRHLQFPRRRRVSCPWSQQGSATPRHLHQWRKD